MFPKHAEAVVAGHKSWLWPQTDPFIATDSYRFQTPFICSDTSISNAEILTLLQHETRWTKPFFFPSKPCDQEKRESGLFWALFSPLYITIVKFSPWITWGMFYHKLLLLLNAKMWISQRMLKTKYFTHNIQDFGLGSIWTPTWDKVQSFIQQEEKCSLCLPMFVMIYIIPTGFFLSFLFFWLGKHESIAFVKACTNMMPVCAAVTWYLLLPSCDHCGCDGGSPALTRHKNIENRERKGLSTDLCRWKTGWNTHCLLLRGGLKFIWSQIVQLNKDGAGKLLQFCCFSTARCEKKHTAYLKLLSNARITHFKASVKLPVGWACCWEHAGGARGAAVPLGYTSAGWSCCELHYPWICMSIWPLVRDSELCLFLSWELGGSFPG